jgi:hypothetical protein
MTGSSMGQDIYYILIFYNSTELTYQYPVCHQASLPLRHKRSVAGSWNRGVWTEFDKLVWREYIFKTHRGH